ncbi:MAG: mannose-6-phosphate isomerase, class I [Spirochaetia bacterium]|nr:mannose-6-phosphate isomerase, class I [Spirochaetia bacterium]
MKVRKLIPYIQHYAWGNSHSIPEILGISPDGTPWAEMWLGTHPKGPALIDDEKGKITLQEYIDRDPVGVFGAKYSNESRPCSDSKDLSGRAELPFLLKILAVEKPLSIQCHPDKDQAWRGCRYEEQSGIPLDAFNRSYKDANHKPEIICALTPFTALCGFRPVRQIDRLFSLLEGDFYEKNLRNYLFNESLSEDMRYQSFFTSLLQLSKTDKTSFLKELAETAGKLAPVSKEFSLVKKILKFYPDDSSAAAPLYLNLLELAPGEALYQPAGELHAYMYGTGVELMANSDNVLRGGLTEKYIDLPELRKIVQFAGVEKEKVIPEAKQPGEFVYRTPAKEFLLKRIAPGVRIQIRQRISVELLLCTSGQAIIEYTDAEAGLITISIKLGDALILPASIGDYILETGSSGEIHIAGFPEEEDS